MYPGIYPELLCLISSIVAVLGEQLKEVPMHNGQPFTADTFFNTLDDPTIQTMLSIIGVEDCFGCMSTMYHSYEDDKDGNTTKRLDMFSILAKIPHLG